MRRLRKTAIVVASLTAALAGSVGLVGAVASPAGADNPLVSVGQSGNTTVLTVSVADMPGAYGQVTFQPNPEGVPLIQSTGSALTITLLSQPGGYVNLTY
jgi:hypothetical protein